MSNNDFEDKEVVHRSRRAKKEALSTSEQSQNSNDNKNLSDDVTKKRRKKKKERKHPKLVAFVKIVVSLVLIMTVAVIIYVAAVISKAPPIETGNIDSLLSQSSILYDDRGKIIDNVFSQNNRTLVEISKIPKTTQNAFIALEDKTFKEHHGFNIVRIFGAIKDALVSGGHISGTSTITQQLARNLYMSERMAERSLNRKIIEAYYSVILEKKLTKDQILEAYLNTVNFGSVYGIQTASQAYFSKDVSELTVAESATLAAIPQKPSVFALVLTVPSEQITEDSENLILKNGDFAYVWNDKCKNRMLTCLSLMHEQGYISDKQYKKAKKKEIKDIINPTIDALNSVSNYFADYVLSTVIKDFQEEYNWDYQKAYDTVYNSGIRIHTTMDSQAQAVIEKEFENDANFPQPIGYVRDAAGNILNPKGGEILLYNYSHYIENDGTFRLHSKEYKKNKDGSITIYTGKRLAIYDTKVDGKTDYSIEFKKMHLLENSKLYVIPGGYLNIPQEYKSRDKKNNLVVSAKFFEDYPKFFEKKGKTLSTKDFSLRQKVIQPQSAMTIIDNKTGAIKAMIGGRKTTGRMLYNRATTARQPGSSIKPIAVYSAALQKSYDYSQKDKLFPLINDGYGRQGKALWGDYITAASIVEDEPLKINGKIWPKNSYPGYRGMYTFRKALQQSVNVCAVKILSQVGIDYSFNLSEKYGLSTLVRSGSANDLNLAALGMGGMTKGVSTLEMASAYTTFVNDGIHKSHSCYTKVTDRNGDVLLEPNVKETEVLNPGVAWIMRDLLHSVVSEGIGFYAKIPGAKVGGKTGTTSDSFDIWFDGFTANYSAAIWIGNDVNLKLSSMSPAAATLWGKIMGQCNNAIGGTYTSKPSNVISMAVDSSTGLLANENSQGKRTEYFTKGTQPTKSGSLYKTITICTETGMLATPSCPHTETITVLSSPYESSEDSDDDSSDDDSGEIPKYYCHKHNPDPKKYPTKPGKKVTIVPIPGTEPEEPEEPNEPDKPEEPEKPNTSNNKPEKPNDTNGSTEEPED